MSLDYENRAVRCEDCGFVVTLTMDWDAEQPRRLECACSVRGIDDDLPDHWQNARKPLAAFGGESDR